MTPSHLYESRLKKWHKEHVSIVCANRVDDQPDTVRRDLFNILRSFQLIVSISGDTQLPAC